MARSGRIDLTVSYAILDELEDVLRRKFDWADYDIRKGRDRITSIARTVLPGVTLDVMKEDPSDNRILECAVAAGSDYIFSGDNDLLRLRYYDSIRILKLSEFLPIAQAQGREI